MRFHLKRFVIGVAFGAGVFLLLFHPQPAWISGIPGEEDGFRLVRGGNYPGNFVSEQERYFPKATLCPPHVSGQSSAYVLIADFMPLGASYMDLRQHGQQSMMMGSRDIPETTTTAATTMTIRHTSPPVPTRPVINIDSIKEWLPDINNTLPNYFTMKDNRTNNRSYRDGILVYMHLNKAAGSTTKMCLNKVAHKRSVPGPLAILDSNARIKVQSKLENGVKYNILMGGYAFGICDAAKGENCSYFTVLRDPYERLLSSFTYCRRAAMDQTCQGLGPWDVSLKEWALHQGSYFFRQLLMKPWFCKPNRDYAKLGLSGILHSPKTSFAGAPCWFKQKVILYRSLTPSQMDSLLAYCLEHLEEWFSIIGLTDHFDLTLAMLEEVYQIPFQRTCTGNEINVSNYRNLADDKEVNRTETVLEWKRELQEDPDVYEALRADILIYEKAKEIFNRQKEAFLARHQP